MSNEETISAHRVLVAGDTVLTRYIGVPELADVMAIYQRFDQVLAEHGRLFIINDMRHSGIPTAEARQFLAEWARTHQIAGLANFGASLPIRILQSLIFRATALLGRHPVIIPEHCAGEAEAFAWVETRRRQFD